MKYLVFSMFAITLSFGCSQDDFTDVAGTVQGRTISEVGSAFYTKLDESSFALVVREDTGACVEGEGSGNALVFGFCSPMEQRRYTVMPSGQLPADGSCPADKVVVLLEGEGGVDVAEGTSGDLEIELKDNGILASFEVFFGNENIVGVVDAAFCAGSN